jgi:4-amino-4-deoxy-L-arabinose transferase-like glycosyltransferase
MSAEVRPAEQEFPALNANRLTTADWSLLVLFCGLLFGFSLVGGRPLTMHEGVLPQTAREMFSDGDWIVPKNGGRPWLESPPLPQWITVCIASLFGRCDEVWIARIGPALAATWVVVLTAWMTAGWFGRSAGLLSGCILATMYEFAQYAWLAEDEMFLCALVTTAVAAFVRGEFFRSEPNLALSRSFIGRRPSGLLLFYAALGATNLAKGLAFGTAMAAIPIAGYLLWNFDWKRIAYYCWFWGWLLAAAIAAAWPLAVYQRYPDVLSLWSFDHVGRLNGDYAALTEPAWYYARVLPGLIAPWTPLAFVGLVVAARKGLALPYSAERFVVCWAVLPPLVFSIPSGKHHHYLLHCVAPWAVLTAPMLIALRERMVQWPAAAKSPLIAAGTWGAVGMAAVWLLRERIADAIPGGSIPVIGALVGLSALIPAVVAAVVFGLHHANARIAGATLFTVVGLCFCAGHYAAGKYFDQCRQDTVFLQQVRETVPADERIWINAATGSLDEFRLQFYLPRQGRLIHNLSFLADERIGGERAYVLTRAGHADELSEFGEVTRVMTSERTRREKSPADRWTLFSLRFHPDLVRRSSDGIRVSPMQAAQREAGPILR